jgi:hypothetical protein
VLLAVLKGSRLVISLFVGDLSSSLCRNEEQRSSSSEEPFSRGEEGREEERMSGQ